jgi:hypothetical protein
MPRRLTLVLLFALLAPGMALAQNKVRTESFKPPGAPAASAPGNPAQATPAKPPEGDAAAAKPGASAAASTEATAPEIITDPSRLPPAVAKTRERILAAARSGELKQLLAVMQAGATLPTFSASEDRDPIAFWKANYPDSEGVEILAILSEILEAGFVHVDQGTQQEVYLWPYFARVPLKTLTPQQRVELFRIITGNDYKDMVDFGAYIFYRVGIAPDGTWQYFVSGD